MQNLLHPNLPARLEFAQLVIDRTYLNNNFVNHILEYSPIREAGFTLDGAYNWRNFHICDKGNRHALREAHFQHGLRINVWS